MQKLMAANWKMFKNRAEAAATAVSLKGLLASMPTDRELLIFAPFTAIEAASGALQDAKAMHVGAQNFYPAPEGAYTGEISLPMLEDLGVLWVLVGHSERRHVFGESYDLVAQKTTYALEKSFKVVLCIGETLEEREEGRLVDVLTAQLSSALANISKDFDAQRLAIAYEPVWAIGTGKVAGNTEILEAHAEVRRVLTEIYGKKGQELRIIYGGSVKADNAPSILALDNVDGVLVGGASLQAESFARIALA